MREKHRKNMNTKGNNTQIVTKTNQIFIQNIMRFHFYKFAFIGVEKTGIKAYRCVALVDSDWRLLAVMRRGS